MSFPFVLYYVLIVFVADGPSRSVPVYGGPRECIQRSYFEARYDARVEATMCVPVMEERDA